MGSAEAEERVLRNVDQSRRAFLKKLILGSAFAIPAVATFSMSGLGVEKAQAAMSNQTRFPIGVPGQENCYGATVAYLEHISWQQWEGFLSNLTYELSLQGLTPAQGLYALAEQWCRYGGPLPRP